jgi:hypothetical protein
MKKYPHKNLGAKRGKWERAKREKSQKIPGDFSSLEADAWPR